MLCIVYRLGVISKNDEFQTIGFHSSSSLNQVTSSNNWYVSLWRGNQVCAEAKANCICLLSPDLNTIEQLLDERPGSFGATSESSTASGWSPLRMGVDSQKNCAASQAFRSTLLWGS